MCGRGSEYGGYVADYIDQEIEHGCDFQVEIWRLADGWLVALYIKVEFEAGNRLIVGWN